MCLLSCSYNKILQKLRMFVTINEIANAWKPSNLISVVNQSFKPLSARFWGHCTAYSASAESLASGRQIDPLATWCAQWPFNYLFDFKLSFTQGERDTQTYFVWTTSCWQACQIITRFLVSLGLKWLVFIVFHRAGALTFDMPQSPLAQPPSDDPLIARQSNKAHTWFIMNHGSSMIWYV